MTDRELMQMAQEAGIVVTGEAVWKLCQLVYEAGRKDERDSYETVLVEPPQGENND